jgi:NDP-sugar pyrophosphorylase family protein
MRAVILAGGKGTRLRPFTTNIPKPVVPVGDMAIMEIVLRQLVAAGCDHATVAVNHLAHVIMAYFGDGSRFGLTIDYSFEPKPLGTIGPLKLMSDLPDNFLVMNGDVLTDLDYRAFFKTHSSSGAAGTVATYEREARIDFGVLEFENAGERRITHFIEKPVKHFSVSMGVYAFNKKILAMVPEDQLYGFDNLMISMIKGDWDVRAYPHDGYWLDIGRPEDYDRANEEWDQISSRLLPAGSADT